MPLDPSPKVSGRLTLTDKYLKSLRPGAREVWDAQQPGLMVRVLPSGRTEFAIRYRISGKRRRLKLGEYPAVIV
jgi:hypothetical protein